MADGSFDVVFCHNTLECLLDPAALLIEIGRVLRPGGRAILGHTGFETIVVTTADRDLTRRVLLTYAQTDCAGAGSATSPATNSRSGSAS